ncbi:Protein DETOXIFICATION 47, chloroplastic [Branchiostoma belcheri]|nr:Protein DETOXIFICATION 47, chloroplastic [Branchiostoma belcheri]
MARGRNEETERHERHLEGHKSHQQDDKSSGRESLKGCPVGPANEERNNMNSDERDGLIAKHRRNNQVGGTLDRNLSHNELGKTARMNHSLKEAGAGPHTTDENDCPIKRQSLKGAWNFDSSGSTACGAQHAHGHPEFANDNVDGVKDLARDGFIYLGYRDREECAFCGGVLQEWEAADDPFIEHERHYPRCPFVNGRATANVQLGATSPQTSQPRSSHSRAHCIVISQTSQQSSTPEHVSLSQVTQRTGSGYTSAFALPVETQWPKLPGFADEDNRLSTFHNWPGYYPMSPLRLVRAGFLYTYVADQVRCFWCEGGLKDWQQDDDPWEEHARWYGPECGYVIMNKGMDYIRDIRTRRPPVVQQDGLFENLRETITEEPVDVSS